MKQFWIVWLILIGLSSSSVSGLTGDLDGDGCISFTDIFVLSQKWLSADPFADFVADGVVNFREYSVIAAHWLKCEDGKYWIRLDFEELGDIDFLNNQYASYGVTFEDIGEDGYHGFISTMIAPFGDVIFTLAPPIGLTEVLVGPEQGNFDLNTRFINFAQPQSQVAFWVFNSSFGIFPEVSATIRAWDGPSGTGSEVIAPIVLPEVIQAVVIIDTGQFNIRSITIQCIGNTAAFDELVFDAGTNPKGGYIDISSDLDGSTPPEVFLNGNPSYRGDYKGTSPKYLISISQGVHTITVYSPGYEWYQQTVNIFTGAETFINAVLFPAQEPNYTSTITLQANEQTLDVGDRAAPYLVDWDFDGDNDLIVGNGNGDVIYYKNITDDTNPQYSTGTNILSSPEPNASPVVIDFYTDKKNDLVIGYRDGTVKIFYNHGTRTEPGFSGSPYDSTLVTIPTTDAVPFVMDWDNDRRKDLLVGGADGNVYLYINQRLDASPLYTSAPSIVATVSSHAAPCVVLDWNADGLKDLIVGDADGVLNLFLNEGTDDSPVYSTSSRLKYLDSSDINVGSHARPLVVYYNNDNRKDIIVGAGNGQVYLLNSVE